MSSLLTSTAVSNILNLKKIEAHIELCPKETAEGASNNKDHENHFRIRLSK